MCEHLAFLREQHEYQVIEINADTCPNYTGVQPTRQRAFQVERHFTALREN